MTPIFNCVQLKLQVSQLLEMSLPISAENLVKFGLGVPCGQLTTALETLIWTDSPRINGADGERGILLFGVSLVCKEFDLIYD